MSQTLTFRYTPTQQDYAQVLRAFFFQRTGTRISLGLLLAAFALIIFAIASQGTTPTIFEVVWLLLPPLFVVFVFFIQPARVAKRAIQNEQLAAETTWELGDEGVDISTQFGSNHVEWDSLSKLVTTRDYYLVLLKTNTNTFRFLPRRAITSPQDQDLFLQIVGNHLPKR